MEPILLIRPEYMSRYERTFAEKYFRIEESRVLCGNSIVVGRYSVLPFYEELDRDLRLLGSRLVNSPPEHAWIDNFDYYQQVQAFTPRSWSEDAFSRCDFPGPFVVKGRRSSKKWQWRKRMFAANKREAVRLAARLKEDAEIREQGVIFREYVPLKVLEIGHEDLPISNEWRFFYLGQRRLCYGFYWANSDSVGKAHISQEAIAFADQIARLVSNFATFYTLDLAEKEAGDWTLIEINDGQTATPTEHDLDEFYGGLKDALAERFPSGVAPA